MFEIAGLSVGEAAFAGQPGPPTMDRLEISGPYNAKGVSETPSRRRIFVCRPARPEDEPGCASKILSTIARRAFRRDVTAGRGPAISGAVRSREAQAEFRRVHRGRNPRCAHRAGFSVPARIRPFRGRPGKRAEVSRTGNWRRASRSFCGAAFRMTNCSGRRGAGSFVKEACSTRRCAACSPLPPGPRWPTTSPHSGSGYAAWRISSRTLRSIPTSTARWPPAFEEETRLFVRSVIRENRSVLDLLSADYTYLNEKLARLYGIPGVIGPGFRRVTLTAAPERGGLLGQGSILLLTSHTTKTSPILRGKWILDSLLNSPPPPPPAGVPPLEESVGKGEKLTARQQIERHRKNAVCASCHARMDPLGFTLENFDVIGRWRTRDEGGDIDASAKLPNGASFSGPQGLKEYLLSRPDEFVSATVARLLTYALGRELDMRGTSRPFVESCGKPRRAGTGFRT